MWLQTLPNGIDLNDTVFWLDNLNGFSDRKTKVAYTAANTATGVLSNSGQLITYNGTSTKITIGDVGDVNTIVMWVNPETDAEFFIDLDAGTATITSSGGTVTANNFSSPVYNINGAATQTIVKDTISMLAVTTATAIDADTVIIGNIGADFFEGSIGSVIAFNKVLTPIQLSQMYNKHK